MCAQITPSQIAETYGGRIRVRVCALVTNDAGQILLIKHQGIGSKPYMWGPPGGGLELYETLEECLARELKEETGMMLVHSTFYHMRQFIAPPLHAIEFYFEVKANGQPRLGDDPEMSGIIEEIKWFDREEMGRMEPDTVDAIVAKYLN